MTQESPKPSFRIAFYKGTRPGIPGVYNYAVRAWTNGPYSHVELIFSDGLAASSSFEDGGVRFKRIQFDPAKWDIIELPAEWERHARAYFRDRVHAEDSTVAKVKYDVRGNVHFVVGFIKGAEDREFCSESAAGALGFIQPWRFHPNNLYSAVLRAVLERAAANLTLEAA